MNGQIAQLSLTAIRMAAAGPITDPAAVARWFYRFGTVPRGLAMDRDFGPEDDPMAVLGLTKSGPVRRLLEKSYEASTLAGWYNFAHSSSSAQIVPACKLYVSPRPEELPKAFPIIARQFVAYEVRSFKVGRGIEGLVRPDKIVAYFEDWRHMDDVAMALEQSLQSCAAQGVPFTCEIGGHGLLSCGVDPQGGSLGISWRAWITKQLSISLTMPPAIHNSDRVAATLADIRKAGIDPNRWIPMIDNF